MSPRFFLSCSSSCFRGAALALAFATAVAACGRSGPNPPGTGAPDGPPKAQVSREFTEGGSITLTTQAGPVELRVVDCVYANTDPEYPDYVELSGEGMYLIAQVPGKTDEDAQERKLYGALVGKALPVQHLPDMGGQPMSLAVPGADRYSVMGGNLHLDRFEHGSGTTDWWEGRIDLTLQTTAGAYPVTGTFKFGIVPVW
ncbi:MAG: hypothetical protein IT364_13005 [Candidatus Hydrogenedentes bacterium]|nr:hypothetical protein [Candidatus Hydrogenedentota bacterium]